MLSGAGLSVQAARTSKRLERPSGWNVPARRLGYLGRSRMAVTCNAAMAYK